MTTRTFKEIKVFDIIAEGSELRGMGYYMEIPDLIYAKEEIWESDELCEQALKNAIKDWEICRKKDCWGTTSHKPELKIYWKAITIEAID